MKRNEHGGAIVPILMSVAAVAMIPVLLIAGIADPKPDPGSAGASAEALSDIPAELLPVYMKAAKDTCNMPWEVLAAIGKIETDHGRSTLPGVRSGENFAGAKGPMQFLQATWDAYGVDGDGDGDTDVYDPVDAIWGAAKYLCANGAGDGDPSRLRNAIFQYNHADWYVDQVLEQAAKYRAAGTGVASAEASALLANARLTLTANARGDLENGNVDQRVVNFLGWAIQNHDIAVSVIKTGHSKYVAGTDRISDHYACEGCQGRAVDVAAVDGEAYSPSCGPCRSFSQETIALGPGRPDQIGLPWADLVGPPGVFTDADHQDHEHAGFAALP
jgi:hypothetical protein